METLAETAYRLALAVWDDEPEACATMIAFARDQEWNFPGVVVKRAATQIRILNLSPHCQQWRRNQAKSSVRHGPEEILRVACDLYVEWSDHAMSFPETKEPPRRKRRSKRRHRDDFPADCKAPGVESRENMWSDQGGYMVPTWDARGYERGYTCLGFRNCENDIDAVAGWLNRQGLPIAPNPHPMGTLESYVHRLDLFETAGAHCREKGVRCDVHLTPQLVGLENMTVKVWDAEGDDPRVFRVGKSTGWLPCHLEMPVRSDSRGGHSACRRYFKVLARGHG